MLTGDVVVVGGGPAGCAAAVTLARAGREVVLVDKAVFPRDKCCGDGLTTAALRRLAALGLRPEAVPSWQPLDGVWLRSPSGREIELPFPPGGLYGAVARRVDLDAALLDVARAAGVKVFDGHALEGAVAHDDRVVLDVDGLGPVAARYAVGADGMWSPLRKALGAADEPGYLGEWHAFRGYFRGNDSRLWVWFEPDLLPGYAWSFPLPDGRVNVGFGVQRRPGRPTKELRALWPELLARPHIRAVVGEPDGPHKAWPIPARVGHSPPVAAGGRALFVGDAARAADPLTGEGIGQALETGVLAAEAVLAAGALRPAAAARAYERAVARGLGVDNRLAAALSRALRSPLGARGALRTAGLTDWTRRNFARWLFEDYPRAVLLTPRRWRELTRGGMA
ncbi:MAG TPA: geranylgeranyl reductase family protein [Acidimicrobiales bacterium]|nr:geranylgeranyl reductase family protein [Acidimicrobiales bacterium]